MTTSTATSVLSPSVPPVSGFGWRVAISILSTFGLLSFVILYFAFWAAQFSAWQSAAIVVVAILVFIGVNGAAWASWGIRQSRLTTGLPDSDAVVAKPSHDCTRRRGGDTLD